ncbi:polysaccharide pyruvyl transferase family protein [Halobacillus andaensis]|uniref:polysaccharide pyruvyl transferase family protein n=1 Tax=Halobacillus andaensis TaxID=1176239 RepID=UPI003D731DEB
MKKKILVNAYFSKNFGDDLFLKVLFDRYPNVYWELLTPNKEYEEIFKEYTQVKIIKSMNVNFLGLKKINMFNQINKFFNYHQYDALVLIGGSIFMEIPNWRAALKEREFLPRQFKRQKKSTFILGSNFGPYSDVAYVDSYKNFFSLFDDVCFRDFYSYKLFNSLNNVRSSPDVVFNLKVREVKKEENLVGFSIINLEKRKNLKVNYKKYNTKMVQLIENKVKNGSKVKLFSFCEKEGDLVIAKLIKENVQKQYREKVEIINYEGDIEGFLKEFQSCGAIIGTRFHSIVLALLLGQRLLPIIYSDKTYNILEDLNLEKKGYFIENVNNISVNDLNSISSVTISRKYIEKAALQFKALDEYLSISSINSKDNYKVSV